MNKPYVKQYNEDGTISNPIQGIFVNKFPNRSKRRFTAPRFRGNHKGVSLTESGRSVYFRVLQIVDGKRIEHYLLK